MPLYEYQCDSCSHRFEVIQKFSDAPIETCPSCGGPVKKLPSSPAIQFKGSGWYITDYARKGQSGGGKSEQSGKSDSGDSKSTSSTDSSGSGSSSSTSGKESASKESASKESSKE
jgi:putative FmdB family regulatory protein